MNIVLSDPKTRKAYSKKIENPAIFAGKKIGEGVELGAIGLEGYAAQITGGSDKEGFPMKKDFMGSARKVVWVMKNEKKGKKIKAAQRGNTVSEEIAQLNLKVTKEGTKPLRELLGGQVKEENISIKEQMVKESLDNIGKISTEEAANIKKAR